jgi:hypothetical protein
MADVRDRIVEIRRMRPRDLAPHPENWRTHPDDQAKALNAVMRDIGKAGVLLAYRSAANGGALTLIDGHLRRTQYGDQEWNVAITDLNDDEARKLLVVHDPLAGLAGTDDAMLKSLLASVQTADLEMGQLLDRIAVDHEIDFSDQTSQDTFQDGAPAEPEELPDTFKPYEFESVQGFVDGCIFPITNEWGLPDLLPDRLATQIPDRVWNGRDAMIAHPEKTLFLYGTNAFPASARGGNLGFYVDDYRFETIWDNSVEIARRFHKFGWGALFEPDFSVCRAWPFALNLFNHYRSRWCARYWQEAGMRVVPAITVGVGTTGPPTWQVAGVPKHAPVMSMQCRTAAIHESGKTYVERLKNTLGYLQPENVLIYGGATHREWLEPRIAGIGPQYHWLTSFMQERNKIKNKSS